MSKNYLFSVIIPVYNVEQYLEETILSVVNQTIGFENIQMILVNDGSPDNSEEICLKYRDKYPDNILYIKKENGGVSSARNLGMEYIQGKYVNFLDSDDKWEENSFKEVYNFFEEHGDEIDVVACRVKFFEAKDTFHGLDRKFEKGTRVADLRDESEIYSVQSTTATTFIRSEAIGSRRFDTELKYGEDSTFINKIMIQKLKVGLLCEALYLYRRRINQNSAVNQQTLDISFYTTSLTNYHLELFRYSKELYGKVVPYIQSMVAYDILWRFNNPNLDLTLTDEKEKKLFFERVREILQQIDEKILLKSPYHRSINKKTETFLYRDGIDLVKSLELNEEEGCLCYHGISLLKLTKNKGNACRVLSAQIKDGKMYIDVILANWLREATPTGSRFYFKAGDKLTELEGETYYSLMNATRYGRTPYASLYKAEYPLDSLKRGDVLKLGFVLRFGDTYVPISMSYGKFVPDCNVSKYAYKFYGDYAIKCFRRSINVSYPRFKKIHAARWEKQCIKWLEEQELYEAAKIRKNYPKYKKKLEKEGRIWLISDRIDNAGDNGEVLFKYICEHKPEGVCPIFVIGSVAKQEVKDRLNSIGRVIYAEDREYPYYFLCAEKIISSSAGEFTINPFETNGKYLRDLFGFKYYFMNHGVNCGDCSKWLNHYNKNIDIFFTTGRSERQNIIDRNYNYSPEQIVITGLSRFDALYDDPKKQLLILPTWRRAYAECYDDKTSSIYYEGFKNTEFFKFYNGLINSEKLLEVMKRKGYTGLFCLHPIFAKQAAHFADNGVFKINEGFVDYNKAFAESNIMVTDYSTIAFDFAFLNKPIVYTQFDKEEFYKNQIYDECFDYDNEGFGPVCEDLESAIDTLCKYIENDCENDYLDRIDSFFVYHDQNNAKRILEAVLADDEKNK